MKKLSHFLVGTLVGATLMTAGTVFADDVKQLVGTKVGSVWELHVDGEKVGDVPIISGSSYAPVRQIAVIAGMDVGFEQGKVFLKTKEDGGNVERTAELITLQIAHVKRLRDTLIGVRDDDMARLAEMPTEEARKSLEETIAIREKGIAEYEAEIAALEAELAELESESTK